MEARPFVVVATARSGSWHLVELLNQHPNVASNGEILNTDDTSWPADARSSGRSAVGLIEWALREAPARGSKGPITARGVKVLDEQLSGRPELWRYLTGLSDVRLVLLRRVNLFEALRSKRQAEATGVWQVLLAASPSDPPPDVHLNVAQCVEYFEAVTGFYEQVRQAFSDRIVEVTYEELCADAGSTLARIYRFLEVSPWAAHHSVLRRQETRTLSEVVIGFESLAAALEDTPWAAFFQ